MTFRDYPVQIDSLKEFSRDLGTGPFVGTGRYWLTGLVVSSLLLGSPAKYGLDGKEIRGYITGVNYTEYEHHIVQITAVGTTEWVNVEHVHLISPLTILYENIEHMTRNLGVVLQITSDNAQGL